MENACTICSPKLCPDATSLARRPQNPTMATRPVLISKPDSSGPDFRSLGRSVHLGFCSETLNAVSDVSTPLMRPWGAGWKATQKLRRMTAIVAKNIEGDFFIIGNGSEGFVVCSVRCRFQTNTLRLTADG